MAPTAILATPTAYLGAFSKNETVKPPKTIVNSDIAVTEIPIPHTIDQFIRKRSEEAPHQAIISYPSTGTEYADYTFRQLDVFASRVAQKYKSLIPQRTSSSEPETVVGLLGPSNIEYLISILALTKLGHTVLFLSTRLSAIAYISLIKETGAKHILIAHPFRDVISEVKAEVPELQVHSIIDKATYEYPLADEDHLNSRFDQDLQPAIEATKSAWIIHSSGSTGLPKPIYQTHSAVLANYASNLGLRGFITLPLYHAHGISSVFRALHSRKQIYMYNATLPLTQQHLLDVMYRYDFDIFYGVPYALKILGETPEGITALAKLKVVMFGGSACPDALGDRLVNNGVNLISHYGTTETGQLMTSFRPPDDKAWNYVRLPETFKPYIAFELRSPGIYELVALNGLPSKVASNRPDGSYATKDLFTPHPSIPNAWKYFTRMDDTIILMNGEKVTPIAFEQSVRDNKYVTEAVLFGSEKARVGMMIIPAAATGRLSTEEIKTLLVPILAKSNETMPAYAQVGIDMVRILPVGTEYPRTDKGTVIRAAFYRSFASQIEEIYETAEVSTGQLCLSEHELREYIRKALKEILPPSTSNLSDDTDLFSVGVDSLQAIQLRSVISKNIRTNGDRLGSNFVFDFPSIESLARELYRLRIGGAADSESHISIMEKLISKYSEFEPHVPKQNPREGRYIVLTGATGSLGAHIASQLVAENDVKKVYCFVRAQSVSNARLRVIRSMQERSVYHNLPLGARKKIIAIPTDFSKASLGLEPADYNNVASEITELIHCAWSVNFNLGLRSFEADCIAGTHNLMALCLSAQRPEPASFNFCSSVSAVVNTKGGFVNEALPESLECAQDMGYAQSKLVTENICIAAGRKYGLKARVLRVGQVVADTVHGIWNATEAIPLMMQAGLTIGAIPRLDETPLWLPVDVVASAVAEISLSSAGSEVMNVVNHASFHWTHDLLPALHNAGLDFSEPTQQEWVTLLRNSNPDPVSNPPIKLVDFFSKKYDNDLPRTGLVYDTSSARAFSPALAGAPVLNQQLVNKFVEHFRQTSWRPSPSLVAPTKVMLVIAGPCGAGKSTIAKEVAKNLSIPWIEGDSLHSESSIAQMSSNIPLSDSDRWLWLDTIKETASAQLMKEGRNAIVVTCSSLKRSYRDELRQARDMKTVFVVLQCREEVLRQRLEGREGHFMGSEMLNSQLASWEDPSADETDTIPVDVEGDREQVTAEILALLDSYVFA